MIKNKHNAISLLIVLVFGFLLFFVETDGFTAFTEETARVNQLTAERPTFPEVTLEDSEGRVYPFSEFDGKYVFITFIYTSCGTVCPQIEMNMAKVYEQVPKEFIGKDIVFLSISFDPSRDDPATLDKYKDYFNSDGETWRMARITDEAELNALLKEFGVTVIPDGNGSFTHNAAFYLVNRDGQLIDIMDYEKTDQAAKTVNDILKQEEGK